MIIKKVQFAEGNNILGYCQFNCFT